MDFKNHMITSVYVEKLLKKCSLPFIIKVLERTELEGIYFNTVKTIYDNFTVNIILNGEKQSLGIIEGNPLSPFLFNAALKVLGRAAR